MQPEWPGRSRLGLGRASLARSSESALIGTALEPSGPLPEIRPDFIFRQHLVLVLVQCFQGSGRISYFIFRQCAVVIRVECLHDRIHAPGTEARSTLFARTSGPSEAGTITISASR